MKHSAFRLPLSVFALFAAVLAWTPDAVAQKSIVMIAGRPSHGPGEHEHNAGCQLLAKCLKQGLSEKVDVKVHLSGEWPSDEELGKADTIVIYCDGGGGHVALQGERLKQLDKEMKRGCGFVCLHYAVEPAYEKDNWKDEKGPDGKPLIPAGRTSKGKGAKEFLAWMGGYFEQYWSVNPHWTANFKEFPKHPVTSGVQPFSSNDEWYYHMRFQDQMRGVTPILSDLPPEQSTKRGDGPHAGNPEQRKAVLEDKQPQHVAWAAQRDDSGRGFGFTGGHFHRGWANDEQRKLVLNAIYWTAKGEVPASGVPSSVTVDDMAANLDPKGKKK